MWQPPPRKEGLLTARHATRDYSQITAVVCLPFPFDVGRAAAVVFNAAAIIEIMVFLTVVQASRISENVLVANLRVI